MSTFVNFPPQQLPFNKKNKKWRKSVVDWADNKTSLNYSLVRKSVLHKKINYDLLNGILHMEDLEYVLNPEHIQASFVADKIQHYPIMNSKLNILRGEEYKRLFDFRVVITNPNSISEIENNKKEALLQRMQEWVSNTSATEEEASQELDKISDYFTYEWQDMREIRANALLNHYVKELNLPLLFNKGFVDALAVGEELYQCDIVGGEPTVERLDPRKVKIIKSGYSNKVEDADIIIIEDYWSPGKIIDVYGESLTKKDFEYIEKLPDNTGQSSVDSMDNIDERYGFVDSSFVDDLSGNGFYFNPENLFDGADSNSSLPYDLAGNIRVLKVFWKSRRRIKKVKSYDSYTGEEVYNFYPETYIIDKYKGEEEHIFYINEAWEGVKIGSDIYVNMRPRVVQYNRLSNPSRCHFGIIGSIYNLNDDKPFSMVDMMKPYNYLYNAVHDRLNKLLTHNWGKIIQLDLAKVPKGWDVEKWMYFARTNNIAVVDSFTEGQSGAARGKLAGALNNASSGVIDAEVGNIIQQNINLLEFIKMEMSEVVGITRQREGQISNRETVGGVERATLQSSHITEWLFSIHDDVKKRTLECLLETLKICLKGRNKKFQYILSDNSLRVMDIEGDEYSESDYGLVADNGNSTQKLNSSLETLAQAALQNQTLSFSTIMKLYGSSSIAEKQRLVESDENKLIERQQQAQQQQLQAEMQAKQEEARQKELEILKKEEANIRDNETKILIANIQANSQNEELEDNDISREALMQKIKEFDAKINLERDKFNFEKQAKREELDIKRKQINKKSTNSK